MIVKHFDGDKVYEIEFPEGSRVYRHKRSGESAVFVPDKDHGEVLVPDTPSCLMPHLAMQGEYGLRLVSEAVVETK